MKTATPYYHLVPKSPLANLEFRRRMVLEVCSSRSVAEEVWIMCSRDYFFFANTFVWIFEPRDLERAEVPLITWACQDRLADEVIQAITHGHDVVVEKSRDMGATWITLTVIWWFFLFRGAFTAMLVSRNEECVEKKGNPKALFEKLRFIMKWMPRALLPSLDDKLKHLGNEDTSAAIDGEPTTGDVGRSGRVAVGVFDEYAAVPVPEAMQADATTVHTTNCRIFISTHTTSGHPFFMKTIDGSCVVVKMPWWEHPNRQAGLYRDPHTNKMRGEWYDEVIKRFSNKALIAAELDMDPYGAGYQYFDMSIVAKYIEKYCSLPVHRGILEHTLEGQPERWVERAGEYDIELWMPLLGNGETRRPPQGRSYVIGADIGRGTGATRSVASIGDCQTGEKVGQVATAFRSPQEFGRLLVAVGRWFNNALIIPEMNGPGQEMMREFKNLSYWHVWYDMRNERSDMGVLSNNPGWWSTKDKKNTLLSEYRQSIVDETFINRSEPSLSECRMYVTDANGEIIHQQAKTIADHSGARQNHADAVIADALCRRGVVDRGGVFKDVHTVPAGCLFERRRRREAMKKKAVSVY